MTSLYRKQVMLVLSDEQVDTLLKTLQPQTRRAIAMWPQEKSENVLGNTRSSSSGTVGSGGLPTRFFQPERRRFQPEPRRSPAAYRTGQLAVQQGQRIPARNNNVESETPKARVWVDLQRSEPASLQDKKHIERAPGILGTSGTLQSYPRSFVPGRPPGYLGIMQEQLQPWQQQQQPPKMQPAYTRPVPMQMGTARYSARLGPVDKPETDKLNTMKDTSATATGSGKDIHSDILHGNVSTSTRDGVGATRAVLQGARSEVSTGQAVDNGSTVIRPHASASLPSPSGFSDAVQTKNLIAAGRG